MKKSILIILSICFLLAVTNVRAQVTNLVPNGDFEIYSSLPDDLGQIYKAIGWNNVNGNYVPGAAASPDYFYVGGYVWGGTINPYSGNGQVGFGLCGDGVNSIDIREYISTHLISSLDSGRSYMLSFYLYHNFFGTPTVHGTKSCNNLGAHFSLNPLYQAFWEPILVTPQVEVDTIIYFTNNWERFTFNFKATDSSRFITIGNFRPDSLTLITTTGDQGSYIWLDKIELYPYFIIKGDTFICKGNTDTLKAFDNTIVKWADSLNPNIIIATDTLITVSPDITTTYAAYGNWDTTYITVHVVSPPIVNLGNDTALCAGQTLTLNATTPYSTYLWQDNSTDSIYKVTQQGTYWIKVINQFNCIGYDTINVNYKLLPQINLGNDTVLCSGKVIVLNATNTSSIYHWQDSSTASTYIVNLQGTYWVRVTNQYNCSAYDTVNIMYKECEDTLIIPNIFTPNGDAFNDYFVIKNIEYWDINLQVFNRWGNEVYNVDNYQNNWDGKYKGNPVSDGTYFYIIKAKGKDSGREKEYKGSLMIMR